MVKTVIDKTVMSSRLIKKERSGGKETKAHTNHQKPVCITSFTLQSKSKELHS
jgi:hypothetical protein